MIAAESRMLTYEQVAERLGVSAKTVSRLQHRGLVVTSIGYHTKRVAELDLLKFENARRVMRKNKR